MKYIVRDRGCPEGGSGPLEPGEENQDDQEGVVTVPARWRRLK